MSEEQLKVILSAAAAAAEQVNKTEKKEAENVGAEEVNKTEKEKENQNDTKLVDARSKLQTRKEQQKDEGGNHEKDKGTGLEPLADLADIMEYFDQSADFERENKRRSYICFTCADDPDIKKYFFIKQNLFKMHIEKYHETSLNHVDCSIYYPCNACREVFGTYDEQLQHRIEHYELYCFTCKKFRGMPMKDDLRHHNECNWSLPQSDAVLRSSISITEQCEVYYLL